MPAARLLATLAMLGLPADVLHSTTLHLGGVTLTTPRYWANKVLGGQLMSMYRSGSTLIFFSVEELRYTPEKTEEACLVRMLAIHPGWKRATVQKKALLTASADTAQFLDRAYLGCNGPRYWTMSVRGPQSDADQVLPDVESMVSSIRFDPPPKPAKPAKPAKP